MLSETKFDLSFPQLQFYIREYSNPYWIDRDRNEGGILLFLREGLPSKLVKVKFDSGNKEYIRKNG